MLSKKTKYALQALIYLAKEEGHGPVLISQIARKERVPQKFLESILLELKNHGVLQSKKGKGGGYFLAKRPEQVSLGNIIRMLDGPLAPLPCLSKTAYRKCDECRDEKTCGIRLVMQEAYQATAGILDGTTLADVLERMDQAVQKERRILVYEI